MFNIEVYAYLARKTNYTRTELKTLSPVQLVELYNEVCFQESLEDWRSQYNVASIMAAIYNTIPRRGGRTCQAKDFFNVEQPTREKIETRDKVDNLAIEAKIKLPRR